MGADLHMNPPQVTPKSLDEQVREILDENREYRRTNARLAKKLEETTQELVALRETLAMAMKSLDDKI